MLCVFEKPEESSEGRKHTNTVIFHFGHSCNSEGDKEKLIPGQSGKLPTKLKLVDYFQTAVVTGKCWRYKGPADTRTQWGGSDKNIDQTPTEKHRST